MKIKDCKSLLESSDFWTLTALWMHFWLLAPGFIRNQWQEKYTVCSHSKASRFPFCNFGAIWQQLTTFGNPIIYQDHKMNAILGFCWRNIITLSSLQIQKLRTTAGHSNFKKQISIVKWTPRWERKNCSAQNFNCVQMFVFAESGSSTSLWTTSSQNPTRNKAGGITNSGI